MPSISICDPLELRAAKRAQFAGGPRRVSLDGKRMYVEIVSITPGHDIDAWIVKFTEKTATLATKQPRWRYQSRF